ncbi:putative generative cell specific-1/HAP2 domain-containing protein [Helianthus annuus]|nr:putative generative cell specific-1/HAP2 domain-containing protein [Helianthus annuus]
MLSHNVFYTFPIYLYVYYVCLYACMYVYIILYHQSNHIQNAGSHSFSIGITEVVNSNLLLELKADDIEYVYQSPGNIVSIAVPTFEALTQYGTATITTNNTGGVEAAYSLTVVLLNLNNSIFYLILAACNTKQWHLAYVLDKSYRFHFTCLLLQFDCSRGVNPVEEQFFTMKPGHLVSRYYKVQPTSDQAAKYMCTAILKDSDFKETDRAECQFTTTATVLDNGTQLPWEPPKSDGIKGYFESVESFWHALWEGMVDFITGKTCRMKCSSFFDLGCHMRHICMTWLLLFGLFLAIFPTGKRLLISLSEFLFGDDFFFLHFCDF